MKRIVMTAAIAVAVLAGLAMGPPSNAVEARLADSRPPDWRQEQCRFASRDEHRGWSVGEVKATLRCAGNHFGGDVDLSFAIVGCESHFHAEAQNGSSSAGGVWQSLDDTFARWVDGARSLMRRWDMHARKLNGRTNAVLGYRVFTHGTSPWSASEWCWG